MILTNSDYSKILLRNHRTDPCVVRAKDNMKKTFRLSHPKIKAARLLDNARHDIKKYIKRERSKELPENMDFWDFDCKFGFSIEDAKQIHVSEISQCLNTVEQQQLSSFYLEILARATTRNSTTSAARKKPSVYDNAQQDQAGETDVCEEQRKSRCNDPTIK